MQGERDRTAQAARSATTSASSPAFKPKVVGLKELARPAVCKLSFNLRTCKSQFSGKCRYEPRLYLASDMFPGAALDCANYSALIISTIFEIKNTQLPFAIDKEYASKLEQKLDVFRKITKTKKQLFLGIISASGLKKTMYSEEMVTCVVDLDDLFKIGDS